MKVHVELLGLSMISEVVGKKKLELEIPGKTVKDVIDELNSVIGRPNCWIYVTSNESNCNGHKKIEQGKF